tara:strand:+ start:194 stop:559 length:366 start_codon:yes stop_codon:yes gene_type:complete
METEYQNNIDELPKLGEFRYENLFKVYQIDGYYIYNIINSMSLDDDMDVEYYYDWKVDSPLPWTTLSYLHYETTNLWWLICIMNGISNPVQFVETGTVLQIIKPVYVRKIIDQILSNINEG